MSTRKLSYIAVIVVCLTALVLAFCFWPTLYRYESTSFGLGTNFLVRIHRISGDTEMFVGARGWIKAPNSD